LLLVCVIIYFVYGGDTSAALQQITSLCMGQNVCTNVDRPECFYFNIDEMSSDCRTFLLEAAQVPNSILEEAKELAEQLAEQTGSDASSSLNFSSEGEDEDEDSYYEDEEDSIPNGDEDSSPIGDEDEDDMANIGNALDSDSNTMDSEASVVSASSVSSSSSLDSSVGSGSSMDSDEEAVLADSEDNDLFDEDEEEWFGDSNEEDSSEWNGSENEEVSLAGSSSSNSAEEYEDPTESEVSTKRDNNLDAGVQDNAVSSYTDNGSTANMKISLAVGGVSVLLIGAAVMKCSKQRSYNTVEDEIEFAQSPAKVVVDDDLEANETEMLMCSPKHPSLKFE